MYSNPQLKIMFVIYVWIKVLYHFQVRVDVMALCCACSLYHWASVSIYWAIAAIALNKTLARETTRSLNDKNDISVCNYAKLINPQLVTKFLYCPLKYMWGSYRRISVGFLMFHTARWTPQFAYHFTDISITVVSYTWLLFSLFSCMSEGRAALQQQCFFLWPLI